MLVGGSILLGLLVWLAPLNGMLKPFPPDVQGCFQSNDLPNIEVGLGVISVRQLPELTANYALEYHKGWVLRLDDALELQPIDSTDRLIVKRGYGRFLSLTMENQVTGPIPQFTIYSSDGSRAATYYKSAAPCTSAG